MPLFNNRAGNAGSGKGIIASIGHRREAVKNLHSEAGFAGQTAGAGMRQDRQGDPFGSNNGPFSSPNSQQRVESATSKARAAGVSERKITKTIGKAREAGTSYGKQDAAFGSAKPNPFTSNQRYGKNLKSY